MSDDNKFSREPAPPSPLFLGQPERDFVKQINDEVIEQIVGQQIAYYPISREHTKYNAYGEALIKNFLPPVRVYALVTCGGFEDVANTAMGPDKTSKITVKFHKRRLNEDQFMVVTNGDFVLYGNVLYEITKLVEPKQLFGQVDHMFEIVAEAIQSRREVFDAT